MAGLDLVIQSLVWHFTVTVFCHTIAPLSAFTANNVPNKELTKSKSATELFAKVTLGQNTGELSIGSSTGETLEAHKGDNVPTFARVIVCSCVFIPVRLSNKKCEGGN
jgi:hypothetical protein